MAARGGWLWARWRDGHPRETPGSGRPWACPESSPAEQGGLHGGLWGAGARGVASGRAARAGGAAHALARAPRALGPAPAGPSRCEPRATFHVTLGRDAHSPAQRSNAGFPAGGAPPNTVRPAPLSRRLCCGAQPQAVPGQRGPWLPASLSCPVRQPDPVAPGGTWPMGVSVAAARSLRLGFLLCETRAKVASRRRQPGRRGLLC